MCRRIAPYAVALLLFFVTFPPSPLAAAEIPIADVDGQPLVANIRRLTDAFQGSRFGHPPIAPVGALE